MRCFRIFDVRFPPFDGTGALLRGARWNSAGKAVIYAAETYAGAILEILVRTTLPNIPKDLFAITIEIPGHLSIENLNPANLPAWQSQSISRTFGDRWINDRRTAVLQVPSIVTHGREHNLLINPAHPDFSAITHTPPEPVLFDERLFRS